MDIFLLLLVYTLNNMSLVMSKTAFVICQLLAADQPSNPNNALVIAGEIIIFIFLVSIASS